MAEKKGKKLFSALIFVKWTIFAMRLICIASANSTGAPSHYLVGSAVRVHFRLGYISGLFLSYLSKFNGHKSCAILLWIPPLEWGLCGYSRNYIRMSRALDKDVCLPPFCWWCSVSDSTPWFFFFFFVNAAIPAASWGCSLRPGGLLQVCSVPVQHWYSDGGCDHGRLLCGLRPRKETHRLCR